MQRLLKWIGLGVGIIAVTLIFAATLLSWRGRQALDRTYQVTGLMSTIMARDSVQLAEGERQTRINGCFTCHGEDLSGTILIDAPPFFVVAPNLTSGAGGIDATYSIEDWDRAVRNGVRPTGKPLIPIMPTRTYHRLADEPFANLVAYIRQLPPIDNEHPPSKMRLLGQVLLGVGAMDAQEGVTTANQRRPPPAPGPTRRVRRVSRVNHVCRLSWR